MEGRPQFGARRACFVLSQNHLSTTSHSSSPSRLCILRCLPGGRIQPEGGYLEHRDYSAGAGQRARTLCKAGADEGTAAASLTINVSQFLCFSARFCKQVESKIILLFV